jgi:hypothetical protein
MRRSGALRRRSRAPRWIPDPSVIQEVFDRTGGSCACGCRRQISPWPIGYHHILPKERWPELVNEPRNIVGVYRDCHANHESGFTRLPMQAVKTVCWLALDGAQRNYLVRTYPAADLFEDSAHRAGSTAASQPSIT